MNVLPSRKREAMAIPSPVMSLMVDQEARFLVEDISSEGADPRVMSDECHHT